MYNEIMNSIDKLAELFQKFPGIGRRQAKRFVYFLLHKDNSYIQELLNEIAKVKTQINQCTECYRFYPNNEMSLCSICLDHPTSSQIMLVEKDADLEALHKTKIFTGKYFVLGGHISSHEKKRSFARVDQFLARIENEQKKGDLKEIIFGLSISPEAEHTRLRLYSMLQEKYPEIKLSTLGRGLSSGIELEYSDSETLKYALESRISQN